MTNRPKAKPYRMDISTLIVFILAGLVLFVGGYFVYSLLTDESLPESVSRIYVVIYGGAFVVVSAMLFVIGHISDDIHYQTYLTSHYGAEQARYHDAVLNRMNKMEQTIEEIRRTI